jgi:NAD(P)-dependent dehydrogenase (short-subunit alcohol dehydrogenase family)
MMKTVVITGSSGLIGTSLCKEFITQGYQVLGMDQKPNNEYKDEANYKYLECDLSSSQELKDISQQIPEVHVLINNAARTDLTFKKFYDVTLEDWNAGIAVNLTSYFYLSQLLMPKLRSVKGSIINVSSTRHLQSEENTEIYSASKGAIASLTHAMAVTQRHFVRVNSISPGWIADPSETLKDSDHEQHLSGRVGRPEDIAKLALYLSSKDADFITGQDFIVDGGMTKKMIYL